MPTYKVQVKWNKQVFDVDLDTNDSPLDFKTQIFSLTGVEPDKQKIMGKGFIFKDNMSWDKIKNLKDGFTFMMIGKAGPLPTAPKEKTIFVEDLPPDQRLAAEAKLPPGLTNLGNTCYMNSTIQTLNAIPELKEALSNYSAQSATSNGGNPGEVMLAASMRGVMNELKNSGQPVTPIMFLSALRQVAPQFAEKVGDRYAQQDAEECWTLMLRALGQQLPSTESNSDETRIDQLLGLKLVGELKNPTDDNDPPQTVTETWRSIKCNITSETRFLKQCLDKAFSTKLEKRSPSGVDTIYDKTLHIDRLPLSLTVQFVRFFWKAGVDNKPGNKSKITKPVQFPLRLDVYDYCSDALKKQLAPVRAALRTAEDERLGVSTQSTKKAKPNASDDMAVDNSVVELPEKSPAFENDTGVYELSAVITHKGRDADGGHYVAWVKEKADSWLLFDDDKVSRVKDDDILKLGGSGGSDWHLAYICVYRARRVEDVRNEWKAIDEEKASKQQ